MNDDAKDFFLYLLDQFQTLSINQIKFPNCGNAYNFQHDDFEFLYEIGSGRFGSVKKFKHTPSGKIIAIKSHFERLLPNMKKEEIERIKLQMKLHQNLSSPGHPNVIEIYGHCFYGNQFLICMEAMDLSLKELYQKVHEMAKLFSENLLGYITCAVLDGLKYCKEKDVIHRDIKPANILINLDGKVKLCDFSESSFLEASVASTYKGTIAYWPPERFDGLFTEIFEKFDVRADIWSLGITLAEIIHGTLPYNGGTETLVSESYVSLQKHIIRANGGEIIARVFDEKPSYSCELKSFIQLCLGNYHDRPKYEELMENSFYQKYANFTEANVVEELKEIFPNILTHQASVNRTENTLSFITITNTVASSNDDIEHIDSETREQDILKKYEYIFRCIPIMPATICIALVNLICSGAFIFLAKFVFPSAMMIYYLYVTKFIICIIIAIIKFCVKRQNLSIFLIYLVIWGINIFNSWFIIVWNYLSCIFPHNLTLNPYGSTPTLVKWGWGIATLFTIIISCNQILYIYVVRWYVRVRKCKQEEVKRNKKKKFHKTSPFFCVF